MAEETNTLPPCGRCAHPPDWHRLDDTAGPWILEGTNPDDAPDGARPAEFRCIGYDCTVDGPIGYCAFGCPDYAEVGELTALHDTFAGARRGN